MSMAATDYFRAVTERLRGVEAQTAEIEAAAELCADRISRGGLVFLFGSGHSRILCEEMIPRQGSFPGFFALVETALSNHVSVIGANGLRTALFLERMEGYAEEILRNFHFGPDDAFILVSTSGIRPVIVEMALGARRRGMPVIALVSVDYCRASKPAHSSGQRLIDVADIVLDNCAPAGDCVVQLEGLPWPTGPVSTVVGATIINMLRCATAESLLARGYEPVVFPAHQNIGGENAERQIERYYEAYRHSVSHLYQ